ncbi:tetratricopeptide repeat protein [Aridibaculum aurantiacum]|uniref:tetratricopeptide repeat protein n=1 Tax=Aridibaculum aurantiacum TaxID=2810307 RepID=UPI001A958636|nr:hypothetical protein [Aridibaculum aurantiacum]
MAAQNKSNTASQATPKAFTDGVAAFYDGNYSAAINEFNKAQTQDPAYKPTYLWIGIAYVASGEKSMAYNTWLRMPAETNAMTTSMYLKGMAEWREGKTNDAKYWFRNTFNYKNTPAYKLSTTALARLEKGDQAPPVSEWPALALLPGSKVNKNNPTASEVKNENAPQTNTANTKLPAFIPKGMYQCYDMYTEANNPSRTSYKEILTIVDGSTYEYKSGKTSRGRYTYDSKTGTITFVTGPYSGGNPTAKLGYRTGDNKPMITLSYTFANLGKDEDFCVLVKSN